MASLKKEVMSLISRFDAAQEAFTANSTDVKKLTKKHKKELKAARAEAKAARVEVEALKAELAILKAGKAEDKPKVTRGRKPAAKRATTTTKAKPAAKRGPGRPAKTAAAKPAVKQRATTAAAKPVAKKGPGRPPKATAAGKTTTRKPAASGAGKRPGRPRKTPLNPLTAIPGVGASLAEKFAAAGVKTPTEFAKLSNTKMKAIFDTAGPRYRKVDNAKMQEFRDGAAGVK